MRTTASGAGKWWRLRYRFGGKEKLLSLGTYPDISLAAARNARDKAREQIAQGIDPSQARKDYKAARAASVLSSLEAVARAWPKDRSGAWKAGTLDAITAAFENHVSPSDGHRPVEEIKPADVRRIVKAVEATGATEVASRVLQRLRAVFRHAIAHELLEVDPAEILKPRKVQHRAALAERDVPEFLRKLDAYDGDPTTKAALGLLMLTVVRPGNYAARGRTRSTPGAWCGASMASA